MTQKSVVFPIAVFGTVCALYAVFSYSLTDPNLVLISQSWYWQFQQKMWEVFFANRQLLTQTYLLFALLLFGSYAWLMLTLSKQRTLSRKMLLPLLLSVIPLFFSYNALSHDVFNYAFNAKILTVYGQDPHQVVALNFPDDPWVRFMHNTHTAAPYGYGWTLLSVFPFSMGIGKFVLTWFSFRLFAVLSIALLICALLFAQHQVQEKQFTLWLGILVLNPLFLIEVMSNMHNDLWMIAPALFSLSLVAKQNRKWYIILISLLMLIFSASIKFATLLLLPLWLLLTVLPWIENRFKPAFQKYLQRIWNNWPLIASMLLFLPLLTPRSQLFHPWYLLWSLAWIPLISQQWWKVILLAFSISGFLRYLPWLWHGNFEGNVLFYQQLITWALPVVFIIAYFWRSSARSAKVLK